MSSLDWNQKPQRHLQYEAHLNRRGHEYRGEWAHGTNGAKLWNSVLQIWQPTDVINTASAFLATQIDSIYEQIHNIWSVLIIETDITKHPACNSCRTGLPPEGPSGIF